MIYTIGAVIAFILGVIAFIINETQITQSN
jgi:hypothetical protein